MIFHLEKEDMTVCLIWKLESIEENPNKELRKLTSVKTHNHYVLVTGKLYVDTDIMKTSFLFFSSGIFMIADYVLVKICLVLV